MSVVHGLPTAAVVDNPASLELGYLRFDGKHYAVTSRVLRLGHAYFATTPLPEVVQPVLATLSDRTGESASIAILDGADVAFKARSSVGSSYMGAVAWAPASRRTVRPPGACCSPICRMIAWINS